MDHNQVKVILQVDVNPTESEEKVKKAIWNLFGDILTQTKSAQKGSIITAEAKGLESLAGLRNVLHRDRIRDAARRALYKGLYGDTLTFYLNKQVAFAGHISFSEAEAESPLGPIKVTVQSEDLLQIIEWLAEKTGRP
jgi:predicted RNA binding protein with dsRBD fold (UPF0201 family)